MRLLIVIAVTAFVAAFSVSLALAHDEHDRCHEDVNNSPPGRYLLYITTTDDHVVVKNGGGASGISYNQVPKEEDGTTSFDYVGHDINVPSREYIFKLTYRTSKVGAILLICGAGNLGSWHPIPLNGAPPPSDNTPTARPTREATPTPTPEPPPIPTPTPTTPALYALTPTPKPTPTATPTPTPAPTLIAPPNIVPTPTQAPAVKSAVAPTLLSIASQREQITSREFGPPSRLSAPPWSGCATRWVA